MPVGAAIGGAAVIGGASSIISGNKAAKATTSAAEATNETSRYIYDQTRKDNAYAKGIGEGALGKLAAMYGVTPQSGGVAGGYSASPDWSGYLANNPDVLKGFYEQNRFATPEEYAQFHWGTYGANEGWRQSPYAAAQNATATTAATEPYGGFQTSPGYQFRVDEAMKAIERSAAARGGLRSGATMDALQRRVQGVASDEYENYANRLAALAGIGQTAKSSDAAAGANYAGMNAQTNMAAGNARASAYANTGNAINQGVQNLTSAYLYNQGYGGGGGGFGGGYQTPPYAGARA